MPVIRRMLESVSGRRLLLILVVCAFTVASTTYLVQYLEFARVQRALNDELGAVAKIRRELESLVVKRTF